MLIDENYKDCAILLTLQSIKSVKEGGGARPQTEMGL